MPAEEFNLAGHSCHAMVNRSQGTPVIFLHGYSFTSDDWQRTGITELLKGKRVPFMALDMPYGAKSRCHPRTRKIESNVTIIREAIQSVFGSTSPVLVGASLGGYIAVQYASLFPVKGLFLAGPTRLLGEGLQKAYSSFKFPVHIIIGSEDRIASLDELQEVVGRLPNAKLTVYEKAGHAAYLECPDKFRKGLLELYNLAEQRTTV